VLFPRIGGKAIFVTMLFIIGTAIFDAAMPRVSIYLPELDSQLQKSVYFVITVIVFAIGQYVVLGFVASKRKEVQRRFMSIHKIVSITQIVLIALLVSIVLQVMLVLTYNASLLKAIVWISYGSSATLLGLLAAKFLVWYKSKSSAVLMSYGIAMAVLSVLCLVTIVFISNELSGQRGFEYVRSNFNYLVMLGNASSSIANPFTFTYLTLQIIAFVATWFSAILLLYHYSKKVGRMRYWIIVSIPLVFFVSQFQSAIINFFTPFRLADPFTFGIASTVVFSSTKTVGGILFGIAFWSMAKEVSRKEVREYMTLSAYGMVLLFTSNQPLGLTFLPFPPMGLATVSFLVLASYLMLTGIYSSALSVANDVEVRRYIKKSIAQQASLLTNIGTAQMEDQIRNLVVRKTRNLSNEIIDQTGIEPSLEEHEIKDYVAMAIDEIKRMKEKSS
jgi:hypothetical protein